MIISFHFSKDINDSFLFVSVFFSTELLDPLPASSFFCVYILVSMLHLRSFPQMPGVLWSPAPI